MPGLASLHCASMQAGSWGFFFRVFQWASLYFNENVYVMASKQLLHSWMRAHYILAVAHALLFSSSWLLSCGLLWSCSRTEAECLWCGWITVTTQCQAAFTAKLNFSSVILKLCNLVMPELRLFILEDYLASGLFIVLGSSDLSCLTSQRLVLSAMSMEALSTPSGAAFVVNTG